MLFLDLCKKLLLQSFGVTPTKLGFGNLFGGNSTLSAVFTSIINVTYVLGLSLSLIFVIIGGIQYITSNGDPQKAEGARATITNAVIGAIIVVGFKAIVNVSLSLFGVGGVDSILNP